MDATPGLSTSDSYSTVAQADEYFNTRLHAPQWGTATNANKEGALVWATRLLDEQIEWKGSRTYPSVQALEWPRTGVVDRGGQYVSTTIIPVFLSNACAELAFYLIKGDRIAESSMAGFSRIKVDVIELEASILSEVSVLPRSVIDMVSFYGDQNTGTDQKKVVR